MSQVVNIRGYYLQIYQSEQSKIKILIVEPKYREKIYTVSINMTNRGDVKVPVHGQILTAKVSKTALFFKDDQACSLKDLLGLEVEIKLKLIKYCFRSNFEHNKGEKVLGTSGHILEVRGGLLGDN